MHQDDEPAQLRRTFFRDSLAGLMAPLADLIEQRLGTGESSTLLLRPPGALAEHRFLTTCHRCSACVEACPAHAIIALRSDDDRLANTPVIDADVTACVVCTDLACMKACPTGALSLVAAPSEIDMGLAKVDHRQCVRSSGDDCIKCIENCPIGEQAIRLNNAGRVDVLHAACVGCGMCQQVCPTRPRAIIVHPHRTVGPFT